jgi:alpha-L-fucosidase
VCGNRIYLHVWNSTGRELCFAELKNRVRSVHLLDGTKVDFEQAGNHLLLRGLPVPLPDPISTTLVIEVEGEPEAITPQTTFWIPGEALV